MRKLILLLLFPILSFAQGGPKVDAIKFRGEITSFIRDGFDVPAGETWIIWNTSTSRLEIAGSDDVWRALDTGVEDGDWLVSDFRIRTTIDNFLEIDGSGFGFTDNLVRLSGGNAIGNGVSITLTDNAANIGNYTNADIDAQGNESLITKGWALENLIGKTSNNFVSSDFDILFDFVTLFDLSSFAFIRVVILKYYVIPKY